MQALRFGWDGIMLSLELVGLALLFPNLGRTLLIWTAVAGSLIALLGKLGSPGDFRHSVLVGLSLLTFTASILGWARALKNRHKLINSVNVPVLATALVLALVAIGLWTFWLSDTDGLPSHHDGVAHSVFFVRTWQQGAFPLTQGFLPFANAFGLEHLQNYPAGSHLLTNLLSLPHRLVLAPLGATTADYLKATLILACSGFPVLVLLWGLRLGHAVQPKNRSRILLAAALAGIAALTYFRFPATTTDQGGWSRILGLSLAWIWAGELLLDSRPTAARGWWLALLGAFFFHPQACIVVCLALAGFWIWKLQTTKERLVWLTLGLITLAVGWWLAPYTQSGAQLSKIFPVQDATWEGVLGRISFFIGQSVFGEPCAREFSILSRRSLGALGLFYFLIRPRLPHARWVLLWLAVLTLAALTQYIRWAPLHLIGTPFYHQTDRMAETFYLPLALGWTMGALLLFGWVDRLKKSNRRLALGAVGILLLQGLGWKTFTGATRLQEHFRHFASVHQSPRFSMDAEAIEQFRIQHGGQKSLLVASPGLTDTWPFRLPDSMQVESLFTFGECPIGGAEVGIHFEGHCARRKEYYDHFADKGESSQLDLDGYDPIFVTGEPAPPEPF